MFANLLAALAVGIAVQALRLASRERIIVQVAPQHVVQAVQRLPELPTFSRPISNYPLPPSIPVAFQNMRSADIHCN
jgi:hypothetical protein